ncbi:GAP1-N2 domain-containing protein, partial [Actinomadura sediminis]
MAWQLHYTSVRRGPTGRSGFQFVAGTPGLPEGARAGVLPHLSYRPPPEAPAEPGDAELDRFPVSLLYDRVDGRPVLVRCRYLGRDYSGRYGNFFGHAVIAEPEELEGVRPAELWRSPIWAALPSPGDRLDELDELPPGAALAPEDLARWLPASGPADPFGTLGVLAAAVGERIAAGDGRVVLVADDADTIARWIALVSYSLPVAAAERLTFVTYSADPQRAAQHLVGTTPGVWTDVRHHASHALAVDLREGVPDGPASRQARTVTACWRDADFAGLDALAELAELDGLGTEAAAVLLALCRPSAAVTADEERGLAALLAARRPALPDWTWRALVPRVPSMTLDLAVAVRDAARAAGVPEPARRCDLRVATLALSDPSARRAGRPPAPRARCGGFGRACGAERP